MIELAFSESAAGALKMAKTLPDGFSDSRPGDITVLNFYLDIGDISGMDGSILGRKKTLNKLFAEYPGVADEIWEINYAGYARLMEAQTTLEPVRMWVLSSSPAELSGLYFVCHLLADAGTPLSCVRIPAEIEKEDCIVSYRNTGEICPESFLEYMRYEQPVSGLQRTVYANHWTSLAQENAPLRAVVNGTLMGVPEDFYDFALRASIPDTECKIMLLIGRALGRIPGTGDQWLYLRVRAMLQSGELVLVKEAEEHHYTAVVKRGK